MGFFSFLFQKPVFIDDPVFGRLRRESFDKRTGKAGFITEDLKFASTGPPIGCYLNTLGAGPTAAQRAFYRRIEEKYAELVPKLIPIIEDEFRNWKPKFQIRDFATEFWLTAISIPELDHTQKVAWNWSFETIHDDNHMLTIYMHDETPEPGLQMDG